MNLLFQTDTYKLGHMVQYAPGTTKVYSYFTGRDGYRTSSRHPQGQGFDEMVFVGLQYILQKYLTKKITRQDVDEFLEAYPNIIGEPSEDVKAKFYALADLGYIPLEVKALPEGSVVTPQTAMFTVQNTHPDFYWVVGYFESLLIKVWYPITVASTSFAYRKLTEKYFNETVDESLHFLKSFYVHDFGYRGDHDEEGAAIAGLAHLASYTGSDCIPAYPLAKEYYGAEGAIMASVAASEHSVMCSYGRDGELDAFNRMLDLYPSGIVSIVSDTYNIWDVLDKIIPALKDKIMARDGKVVCRPDSGFPEDIICGTVKPIYMDDVADNFEDLQAKALAYMHSHVIEYELFLYQGVVYECSIHYECDIGESTLKYFRPATLTSSEKGVLMTLWEIFGGTVNSKGYKVLDSHIGLIYGDAIYLDRYRAIYSRMAKMGFAASNLVVGVGGILRDGTRDTIGAAMKATYVEVNGEARDIEKDPITGPGKKSKKGRMYVDENFVTHDQATDEQEASGMLQTVFKDGEMVKTTTIAEIRERINSYFA